ncbi:MAG: hypothetical protein KAQ71_14215, partial [Desulfobulbaceae bacterium]|nr:hypothetical protein [Desulfobulbaceae bacterium]
MSSLNVSDGVEAIQELKAAILAIEWEINDEALETLLGSLGPLREKWAGKKAFLVCLQIMGTLGGYIKTAREKAHPDAIKLLHSVFDTLDLIVTDDTLSDSEKTEKVRAEVAKYNELIVEIAAKPAAPAKEVAEDTGPLEESTAPTETIKNLMEDKDKIAEEPFNELYQEMVKDERKPPAAPSPATAMPSMQQPGGADAKEVILDRVDDEAFPEADQLIDDFFSEGDELELSPADEEPAVEEVAEEGEEIIEFNLTKVTDEEDAAGEAAADEEFRSKIEAEIALRLDFEDQEQEAKVEQVLETEVQKTPEPVIAEAVSPDLDAIIDSFAGKLAAALTAEIKKKVQEEIEQLRSEL